MRISCMSVLREVFTILRTFVYLIARKSLGRDLLDPATYYISS
jgi:hypothetical protein